MRRHMEHRKRDLSTLMGLWWLCANARCRRNHACIGDAHRCYDRIWDATPQGQKEVWCCAIEARCNGIRTEQALAEAVAARFRKLERLPAPDPLARPRGRPVDRLPTRW